MNEEKLEQILIKIGQTEVPPEVARIAELTSQRFTAALSLPQPRFFTPLRLLAAAAVIAVAFAAGRWSIPASPDNVVYAPTVSIPLAQQKNVNSFWHQKALAAMQPRPYAQPASLTNQLNAYKQYLKK